MKVKMKTAALACAALSLGMTASAQQLTPTEEGRRLFLANNCYGCHGLRGGGGSFVGAPSLRTGQYDSSNLSDVMREGKEGGMPAFPSLYNNTDLDYLYSYMQSLGTASEPIFNLWWEPVPLASVKPHTTGFYAARQKTASLPAPLMR